MKLNLFEQLMADNPVRATIQRHIEGPMLKRLGSQETYPLSLEIGCGSGIGAQVIAEQFGAKMVIATDIDPEQIKWARNNLNPEFRDRIEFRIENALALAEPDESFDAVFSFGVLHHTEDWRKAVKEIARVLKRNGEFFFEEPFRPFLRNILVRPFTAQPEAGKVDFDYEEFRSVLSKNNIEMINTKRIKDIAFFCVGRKR